TLIVTGSSSNPVISLNPTSLNFTVQQGSSDAKVLNISNVGGGTLNWSATANTSTGGPWLTLSFSNGTAPSGTTVLVTTSGLAVGTYTGQVPVSASEAANSPQTIPATLSVTGSPPPSTPPHVDSINPISITPSNFTLTINGSGFDGGAADEIVFPNGFVG